MFELNDKVVYPGHGVAIVESIQEKKVAGRPIKFFKMSFLYKDMTILVPIHSLESTGVRYLSDEKTIQRALNELFNSPEKSVENLDLTPSGWNRRNKDYQFRIQNGELADVAYIYRDLMHISATKDLSFGEKGLLQSTEELMAQEIMVVRGQDKADVLLELRAPFKSILATKGDQLGHTTSL